MPERQKVTQLQLIGTYAEDLQRITTGGRLKDSKKKKKFCVIAETEAMAAISITGRGH